MKLVKCICGGDGEYKISISFFPLYLECKDCGYQSPAFDSEQEAAYSWNETMINFPETVQFRRP